MTREDGTLEFVSYDEKIVLQCQENALANNDTLGSSSSPSTATSDGGSSGASGSDSGSTNETCSTTVAVGLYYNDVWEYDLNCTRLLLKTHAFCCRA